MEPESGIRYIDARLTISLDQVEEFFGDFHCACVAISGKGSQISRHALVSYACKSHFFGKFISLLFAKCFDADRDRPF